MGAPGFVSVLLLNVCSSGVATAAGRVQVSGVEPNDGSLEAFLASVNQNTAAIRALHQISHSETSPTVVAPARAGAISTSPDVDVDSTLVVDVLKPVNAPRQNDASAADTGTHETQQEQKWSGPAAQRFKEDRPVRQTHQNPHVKGLDGNMVDNDDDDDDDDEDETVKSDDAFETHADATRRSSNRQRHDVEIGALPKRWAPNMPPHPRPVRSRSRHEVSPQHMRLQPTGAPESVILHRWPPPPAHRGWPGTGPSYRWQRRRQRQRPPPPPPWWWWYRHYHTTAPGHRRRPRHSLAKRYRFRRKPKSTTWNSAHTTHADVQQSTARAATASESTRIEKLEQNMSLLAAALVRATNAAVKDVHVDTAKLRVATAAQAETAESSSRTPGFDNTTSSDVHEDVSPSANSNATDSAALSFVPRAVVDEQIREAARLAAREAAKLVLNQTSQLNSSANSNATNSTSRSRPKSPIASVVAGPANVSNSASFAPVDQHRADDKSVEAKPMTAVASGIPGDPGQYVDHALQCIVQKCSGPYVGCQSSRACAEVFRCLQSDADMQSCVMMHGRLLPEEAVLFEALSKCEETFQCFTNVPPPPPPPPPSPTARQGNVRQESSTPAAHHRHRNMGGQSCDDICATFCVGGRAEAGSQIDMRDCAVDCGVACFRRRHVVAL